MTTTAPASTRVDPERVLAMLALAFSADPGIRWLFPETARYQAAFGDLVRVVAGGAAFDSATLDTVYDGAGAALWVPPGIEPEAEGYANLFATHIDTTRQAEVIAWGEELGRHHPAEPHWYLAVMGVDPHWQGQGFGSVLLRHGLERCDRDGLPAYVESGSPRNRALYERHGFTAVAEIQVADAPPVWPMLRAPRA